MPHAGHPHLLQHVLGRRKLMRGAVATAGLAISSGLWMPTLALAREDPNRAVPPRPIPQTLPGTPFHVLLDPNNENATITDFDGVIGVARIQGTGTQLNTTTNVATSGLLYDADMRFMQGKYVGVDGQQHRGTFGFL
jgi:hypothetical protein